MVCWGGGALPDKIFHMVEVVEEPSNKQTKKNETEFISADVDFWEEKRYKVKGIRSIG